MKIAIDDEPQPIIVSIPFRRLKMSTLEKIINCKKFTANQPNIKLINKIDRALSNSNSVSTMGTARKPPLMAMPKMEAESKSANQTDKITKMSHDLNNKNTLQTSDNIIKATTSRDISKEQHEVFVIDDEENEGELAKVPKVESKTKNINNPVLVRHQLSVAAAPKRVRYFNNSITEPLKQCTTNTQTDNPKLKDADTQTNSVHVVSEDDYQIIELIKAKGLTTNSLFRFVKKLRPEDVNNNENSLHDIIEIVDLANDDVDIDEDLLNMILCHSAQNKALLKKFYGFINGEARALSDGFVNNISNLEKISSIMNIINNILVNAEEGSSNMKMQSTENSTTTAAVACSIDVNNRHMVATPQPIQSDYSVPYVEPISPAYNDQDWIEQLGPKTSQALPMSSQPALPAVQVSPPQIAPVFPSRTVPDIMELEPVYPQTQTQVIPQVTTPIQQQQPQTYLMYNQFGYTNINKTNDILRQANENPNRQTTNTAIQHKYPRYPYNNRPMYSGINTLQVTDPMQKRHYGSGAYMRPRMESPMVNTDGSTMDSAPGLAANYQGTQYPIPRPEAPYTDYQSVSKQQLNKWPLKRRMKNTPMRTEVMPYSRPTAPIYPPPLPPPPPPSTPIPAQHLNKYQALKERQRLAWMTQLHNYPNAAWTNNYKSN